MVIRAVTAAAPNCLGWLDGVEVDLLWTCHDSVRPKTTLMHACTKITRSFFFYSFIVFDHFLAKTNNLQPSSRKLLHSMSFHCVELLNTTLLIVLDIDYPCMSWHHAVVWMGKSSCVCDSCVTHECMKPAGDFHCDNPGSSFATKSIPEVTAQFQTAWMGIFSFGWGTPLRDSIYHPWLPQR